MLLQTRTVVTDGSLTDDENLNRELRALNEGGHVVTDILTAAYALRGGDDGNYPPVGCFVTIVYAPANQDTPDAD